jgi:FkbM family methyltransferase
MALWQRARWLATLGRSRRASVTIFAVALSMPLKRRVRALSKRIVALELVLGGDDVDLSISDYSELLVLEEIWRRGEYGPAADAARKAHNILDLGANIGLASLWFRAHNRSARIVAVEADPRTFAKLARNVAHDPGIEPVHAAIADHGGNVALISSEDSWNSAVAPAASTDELVEVPSTTVDDLVSRLALYPLDVVKIDIEGMEWTILPSSLCLDRAETVIGEIHPHAREDDPDAFLDRVAAAHGLVREAATDPRFFLLTRT